MSHEESFPRFRAPAISSGTTALVALLLIAAPAAAHHHHAHAAAETLRAATDTAAASGAGSLRRDHATPPAPFVMPPLTEALREHPHNKVVHFPIALALAATLLLVAARRRPELEVPGRWLVWLAAMGAGAAYWTGRLQEEAFEGEPKEWLVHVHKRWGTTTAIVLVAWALLTLWKPARRYVWLVGLVAAALVIVTGFYGGMVAHGE